MSNADEPPLRLAALDDEDLAVVSAHLQDAEATLSQMTFLREQARFVLVVARFDWLLAGRGSFVRRETGLHFERVLRVERSGFADAPADEPLRLLAIAFLPLDPPGGTVLLTFVGGARIRLSVECLEAEMRDLGRQWPVASRPPAVGAETAEAAPGARPRARS